MWQLSIFDIFGWFKSFFFWMDMEILFDGNYYSIKYLPRSYLPVWILISTPFFIILFFLLGAFISGKLIFKRLLSIKEDKINKKGELWINLNEKKDFFIFVSFFSFVSYAVLLNVAMLSGWRHFYFLHIFIVYLSTVGINWLYEYSKKFISQFVVVSVFILLITSLCFTNYKFHPFQSLYFTNLLNKEDIKKYQVDSPSITRSSALKFISDIEKDKDKKIFVANASWTPLYNGKDMLENSMQKKFVFVGQEYSSADYIYTNFIFKSNEKYNKNFKIPNNFVRIKDFKINDILIYSIYKKKK